MYIDTLARIKDALQRKKERIKVPYSRLDEAVLESLVKYGYLEEVSRKGRGIRRIAEIKFKYDKDGQPLISDLNFISKPSRRMYIGWKDIKKSHQGYGHYFLSTPKGIMVDFEARKNKVGGELLFEIW